MLTISIVSASTLNKEALYHSHSPSKYNPPNRPCALLSLPGRVVRFWLISSQPFTVSSSQSFGQSVYWPSCSVKSVRFYLRIRERVIRLAESFPVSKACVCAHSLLKCSNLNTSWLGSSYYCAVSIMVIHSMTDNTNIRKEFALFPAKLLE